MGDFNSLYLLLLFVIPVFYLLDTSLVIWRRNKKHFENRLASFTALTLGLMIFSLYIQHMLPTRYALNVSAFLVYPSSLLSAGLSLFLHMQVAKKYIKINRYAYTGLAAFPILLYSLVLAYGGKSALFAEVKEAGIWNQEVLQPAMYVLLGLMGSYSIVNIWVCVLARRKSASDSEKNRYSILIKANVLYQLTTMFVTMLIVVLHPVFFIPTTFLYLATLIWAVALRIYMSEDLLPSVQRKFELLYKLSPVSILLFDRKLNIQEANPAAAQLFGYESEQDLKNRPFNEFLRGNDRLDFMEAYRDAVTDQALSEYKADIRNRGGANKTVVLNTGSLAVGDEWYVLAVIRDITKQLEEERYITYMAHHDALTKLPNRYAFNKELEIALSHPASDPILVGVLLIDLDRFKLINDTLGHEYGDQALIEMSSRLVTAIEHRHFVARLGGDEFILMVKSTEYDDIIDVAERLLLEFREPVLLEGQEFFLGCSIGISVSPYDGMQAADLIKKADMAMYQAKHSGGSQYRAYVNELNETIRWNVELETHLRRGLDNREFVLHYQPQIEIETGRLAGIEALIRWNSPSMGLVPPGEFIPLAERTGVIVALDRWVLREACRQTAYWHKQGATELVVSVNVSAQQFMQPDYVSFVEVVLLDSGLHPSKLCLEITETTVVRYWEAALAMMNALNKLGVRLAIDDFGTGYSSLSLLRKLPVNVLKIDRSFVTDLGTGERGAAIGRYIVSMGHELKLELVAEGIETAEQQRILSEWKCDYAQGYYHSKPMKAEDLEKSLFR